MNLSLFVGASVMEEVRAWFSGFFGAVLSIIPKLLYFLCTLIFQILDILQILIRKVAGLDVVYYDTGISGGGGWQDGDIVFKFIQTIFNGENAILSNVFWAFIILGVIMLIITTFIAVLRSEYAATDAKSASKGKIIGKALKAIASFAIVPIVCFFGVFLANVILQALDSITTQDSSSIATEIVVTDENGEKKTISISQNFVEHQIQSSIASKTQNSYTAYNFYGNNQIPTTTTPISGMIFKAAASQANRIRFSEAFRNELDKPGVGINIFDQFGGDYESSANLLDEAFANAYKLKDTANLDSEPFKDGHLFPFGGDSWISNKAPSFQVFNKNNVNLVWYYYDLWSFNFVIGIGALIICAMLLLYLVFGLMKRIFELLVLFLIAPPLTALMPLDDGAALKKWREKFTSKVIGAYGPIVGLNLFFIILPFINSIRFFGIYAVDAIINMFFVIVGLIMIKDLVGTISELIGADNTLKSGTDMAGEVGGTIAKIGKTAVAPIGLGVKAVKGGVQIGRALSKSVKNRRMRNEMDKQQMENLASTDIDKYATLEAMSGRKRRKALAGMRAEMSEQQLQEMHDSYLYEKGKNTKLKRLTRAGRYYRKAEKEEKKNEKLEKKAALIRTAMAWDNEKSPGEDGVAWKKKSTLGKFFTKQKFKRNIISELDDVGKMSSIKSEVLKDKRDSLQSKLEANRTMQTMLSDGRSLIGLEALGIVPSTAEGKAEYLKKLKKEEKKLTKEFSSADNAYKAAKGNEESRRFYEELATDVMATRAAAGKNYASQARTLAEKGGMLKTQEALKTGKEIGQGIVKALGVDQLGPIFSTLGANLAKGFKDAGGLGEIKHRIQGLSAKEVKIGERFKEQKGLISAQDSANEALNRTSSGPSQVSLSKETIDKLADAIVNSTKK